MIKSAARLYFKTIFIKVKQITIVDALFDSCRWLRVQNTSLSFCILRPNGCPITVEAGYPDVSNT